MGLACLHKDLNPGRCNSTSDCPAGQTCDLSPAANGTCVCAGSACGGRAEPSLWRRGGGAAGRDGGRRSAGAAGKAAESNARCAAPTPSAAGRMRSMRDERGLYGPDASDCPTARRDLSSLGSDSNAPLRPATPKPGVCHHSPCGTALHDGVRTIRHERTTICVPAAIGLRRATQQGHADDAACVQRSRSRARFERQDGVRHDRCISGTVSGGDSVPPPARPRRTLSVVGQQNERSPTAATQPWHVGWIWFLRDPPFSGRQRQDPTRRRRHLTLDT